eukprot:gene241-320_t
MFETLSNSLIKAMQTLKGHGKITEINVAATVKEIRRALIQADVNYKVAKQITDDIKSTAIGKQVLTSVSPGQVFTKIVQDELTKLMGSEKASINLTGKPAIILMVGLQGSGKTTFSSKLAQYIKKQNKSVSLIACDIYRPAAIEQLHILGKQIDVEVFSNPNTNNVIQIAKEGLKRAQEAQHQVVIIDTAGRQTVDLAMMQEIKELQKAINPSETLLVLDAMVGQDAVTTAGAFYEQLHFDGVVLTKLDGDTRGGAALSIRAVIDRPIKFIGTGEKVTDVDLFYPDRMAQRILGMGDIVSLVERAEQVYSKEEERKLSKKIQSNRFSLADLYEQLQKVKTLGTMKELFTMIPGIGKLPEGSEVMGEAHIKSIESIILSMTPQERIQPSLLNMSRKMRIAKGSGQSVQAVNELLKKFDSMCQMMKQWHSKDGLRSMAAQFSNRTRNRK